LKFRKIKKLKFVPNLFFLSRLNTKENILMNVIMRELTEKKNTVEVNRVVQERHQFVGQNAQAS